jgi:osmoprotectant transport system permease protein
MLASGFLGKLGMLREYANQGDRFWAEVGAQVTFSAVSVAIAVVAGVALGILAYVRPRARAAVFTSVSVFQTIPGLAMIGLLFAPLSWLGSNVAVLKRLHVGGLGWTPVVTALTLYALLAVVRNTYAGLAGVAPETIDAGLGMGMTPAQLMRQVRVPLAMPVLFGGIRTAAVQTIGNATLGAFVAAGTLGLFIFGGLSQQATDLIMLGSVSLVVLAIAVDAVLRVVQELISPRHLRHGGGERR